MPLRAGVGVKLNEQWVAKVRFAGRYSTHDSNRITSRSSTRIPASDGLRFGDSTFDEIYVEYQPAAAGECAWGASRAKPHWLTSRANRSIATTA